ncbi:MAG: hypothetical protein IJ071_11175 [Ruminococcus sp.]|nr:hypothetical protein [Ruminococcus sp.]
MKLFSQKRASLSRAIREAIDSYPEGLCFSSEDGKPILVNTQMNKLVSLLTGHTIIETFHLWQELSEITDTPSGCRRITMKSPSEEDGSRFIFRFPDGRIWRFERTSLKSGEEATVQLKADDITELYSVSEELYENNLRLSAMNQRQKALLKDIVEINRDKEFLAAKMKIHDEFGRCLVATKKAISEGSVNESMDMLISGWQAAIRGMSVIPLQQIEISPEEELMKVASMIGCRINMNGDQPKENPALSLLYAAIREALTNAVRHAGADELTVELSHNGRICHAEIYSNGTTEPVKVVEGVGLGSLRKSLEQEGAILDIDSRHGVRLILDIPE